MERLKGISMIVLGAMMWGATGPIMEWMLGNSEMSIQFMLVNRLLVAGVVILYVLHKKGVDVKSPVRQKVWLRQVILFGMFGMLGVQYSFLAAIEASDAIWATLAQFLSPIYVILFVSIYQKRRPPVGQIIGMFVTLIGLFFLLTNGSLEGFTLSGTALFWGIAVGLAFSFYTLYPARLMQEWGVIVVVGWGMVVAGTILFILNPIRVVTGYQHLSDWRMLAGLLVVIVIGTLAFILFLGSMSYITPVETSILSSFEPLTAMVISIIWFKVALGTLQIGGALTMLIGVIGISLIGNKVSPEEVEPNVEWKDDEVV